MFQIAVILALTLLNAFFSGAEIAIVSVRKTRLKELADGGSRAARAALELREQPERFLATVQVGITVVGATAGAFGGSELAEPLGVFFQQIGVGRFSHGLALTLIVVAISTLSIVLGELVPKSLALRSSERYALLVSRIILLLSSIARPLVWLLTAMSNVLLLPFRDTTNFTEIRVSPEELSSIMTEAAQEGAIDPRIGDMASRVIALGELRLGAVAIPRTRVVVLASEASNEDVWDVLRNHPHTRYPVVDGSVDNVIGYVTARDLYAALVSGAKVELRRLLHEALFLPEQTVAVEALKQLQSAKKQMAIVIDEQGAVAGLVTIEDIAEELLGDILSEHERPSEDVQRENEHAAVVRATIPLHDLNRALDLALPQDPSWTTLAGLILARAGRVPQRSERIAISDHVEAEVLDATARQLRLVRLHIAPPPTSEVNPSSEQSEATA